MVDGAPALKAKCKTARCNRKSALSLRPRVHTPQKAADVVTLQARSSALDVEIRCWQRGSAEYPSELLDLKHPPTGLYAMGSAAGLAQPRVAIVGTRASTGYGERITRTLTRAFVRAGVTVISGMARGIDGAAHRTTLEEGGNTVAVLGT